MSRKTKAAETTPTATKAVEKRPFRAHATREVLAIDPKAFDFEFAMADPQPAASDDGIAVVSIDGPLEHHGGWWFDSYDSILERIECALAEENTKALVLCIDSPGGEAAGMVETHRKIRSLAKQHGKPVYAFANECAASAAYGIASAADEIWLPETAHVGSVGVIACVYDRTKANAQEGINVRLITTGARKGDGHPDKPLTKDVVAALQESVDTIGASFFGIVAESRGMTTDDVQALEAGVFYGADAIGAGLADKVGNFDELMAYVRETVRLAEDNEPTPKKRPATSPTENKKMSKRAQAAKAVHNAKTALLAAKSDEEKKSLLAKYEAAVKALARCEDAEDDEDKDKKADEGADDDGDEKDADEDADEDAEEDDAEDDMDEKEDADEDKDGDDDSTGADEEDDEDDKKALGSKTGLYTNARLYRLCKQVTGEKNVRAVFGALSAMQSRLKNESKMKERLQALEQKDRRRDVESMVSKAIKDRRVSPGEADGLKRDGMKMGAKWLKGHLENRPKMPIRSLEEGGFEGAGANGGSAFAKLNPDQQKMIETSARVQGRDKEEVAKELLAKVNNPGAAARH